jgi:hypothetical protein
LEKQDAEGGMLVRELASVGSGSGCLKWHGVELARELAPLGSGSEGCLKWHEKKAVEEEAWA